MKPLARWVVVGAAIAFLLHTLVRHWADISALRISAQGWSLLMLALGVTLLAHIWAGWVWSWALQALQQPITGSWSAPVYLQTNLLKYLPGNVWHFFGRVRALRNVGVDNGSAIVGVALEPLLMAAAALVVGIATPTHYWPFQLLGLGIVLVTLSPRWLNPLVNRLSRSKTANQPTEDSLPSPPPSPSPSPPLPPIPHPTPGLRHYPLKPLFGQLGYVALRGVGFCLVLSAVTPLAASNWPSTISAFSLAWLGGLVVPGAPGGLGVFEAIALSLLQGQFSAAVVLSAVVLYRVVSTLAEALGAALATFDQGLSSTLK
ncbi:flippase-like domain-containing protein [Phormidium sp. FACHB-322]|nr:flippase-like domain-containing protein [Phormidium sp. FACHB-77]MBD2030135.1 flippase-like domain-containing protein [Phormidium sp. FACHB-322]MBD2051493.1 flippase-like domain-containing protein [Leptolyngbya sp. FACHB-60]